MTSNLGKCTVCGGDPDDRHDGPGHRHVSPSGAADIEALLGTADRLAQELRANRDAFGLDDEEDPEGYLALAGWPPARAALLAEIRAREERARREGIEEAAEVCDLHARAAMDTRKRVAYEYAATRIRALSAPREEE